MNEFKTGHLVCCIKNGRIKASPITFKTQLTVNKIYRVLKRRVDDRQHVEVMGDKGSSISPLAIRFKGFPINEVL